MLTSWRKAIPQSKQKEKKKKQSSVVNTVEMDSGDNCIKGTSHHNMVELCNDPLLQVACSLNTSSTGMNLTGDVVAEINVSATCGTY